MTKSEIIKIQTQLVKAGWPIEVDGIYGPKTHNAYQSWLNANTPATMPTPAPAAAIPWWQSRAIVGILVSVVAVIAERMGWIVDADTLTTLAVQFAEFAGLALAFVGTVRRRAPIDSSLVAPGVRYPTRSPEVSPERRRGGSGGPFGY